MELNVSEEIFLQTTKITASCQINVFQALYQTLNATKMNFENCLAKKFSAGQWLGHFKALRIRLVEGGIQTRLHFYKMRLLASG